MIAQAACLTRSSNCRRDEAAALYKALLRRSSDPYAQCQVALRARFVLVEKAHAAAIQEANMVLRCQPYIPKTIDHLMSQLTFILMKSPTFEDPEFPGRNVETAFFQLNKGLENVRAELGEARFRKLRALSDRVRAHFEADPEDANGQTRAGRQLVLEMEAILEKG
jgi:hypothetical protein